MYGRSRLSVIEAIGVKWRMKAAAVKMSAMLRSGG